MTEPEQTTEQLTIVFADVVASTSIYASAGRLKALKAINDYLNRADELCEAHDGHMLKYIGDGFLAVFNEPARAVVFARAFRDSLAEKPIKVGDNILATRIGIHTGQVLRIETEYGDELLGSVVNVAARLESAAGPDEILVSASTYQLLNKEDSKIFPTSRAVTLKHTGPIDVWSSLSEATE